MTNSSLVRSVVRGQSRVFLPALLAVLLATLLPAARTSAQAGPAPATISSLSGPYTQTVLALPGGARFTGPVTLTAPRRAAGAAGLVRSTPPTGARPSPATQTVGHG